MKFNMDRIEELVEEALLEPHTGDAWIEEQYQADVPICGHTNPYYKFFYMVAKEFKPQFSVELGTYRGNASGHLSVGSPDGIVYAIDWHRDSVDKVHQVRAIAMAEHCPNMTYINKASWDEESVRRVTEVAVTRPIDILFIDAWHWYEHAIREWGIYRPLLADEALVICDDINDSPGSTVDMVKFWNEVREGYENFTDNVMHFAVPMGFVRFIRK